MKTIVTPDKDARFDALRVCELRFTVPGIPAPKGRPMFVRNKRTGAMRVITPRRTRTYEHQVGMLALAQLRPQGWPRATTAPCAVRLDVFLPDRQRRDLDNIQKAIFDGLNKVAWADDSQVCAATITSALDRDNPRVEVLVRADIALKVGR